jgi:hypothetical protein
MSAPPPPGLMFGQHSSQVGHSFLPLEGLGVATGSLLEWLQMAV